jgi:hypothetical protein
MTWIGVGRCQETCRRASHGIGHRRRGHRLEGREVIAGWCQGKFSAVPAVLASAHEQSVPIFQQLARGNPSGRDDVRAIPTVAAQRRGFVGRARDRHQPRDRPVLADPVLRADLLGLRDRRRSKESGLMSDVETLFVSWPVGLALSCWLFSAARLSTWRWINRNSARGNWRCASWTRQNTLSQRLRSIGEISLRPRWPSVRIPSAPPGSPREQGWVPSSRSPSKF